MNLSCMAGVEFENKILFTSRYMNGLFELDLATGLISLVSIIKGEIPQYNLYRKAFLHNKEAWFIPQRGEQILCVNLETYDISYYRPGFNTKYEENVDYPYWFAYIDGVIVEDRFLFCIPSGYDALQIIDMQEHELFPVYGINNPYNDIIYSAYVRNGEAHLLSKKGTSDVIVKCDGRVSGSKDWKHNYTEGYLSSIQNGNDLYLIQGNMPEAKERFLTHIDLDSSNNVERFEIPTYGDEYYGGIYSEGIILLFPDNGKQVLKFDTERREFAALDIPNNRSSSSDDMMFIARRIDSKDKILMSFINTSYIYTLAKDLIITDIYNLSKIDQTEIEKMLNINKENGLFKDVLSGKIIREGNDLGIRDFIHMI